ncbi:unnamed protein product [Linum trigynum]|uniref:Uncharacterized protein n=1 Tax=Linum trigynum TaxID=586398 RepID=A0AAV2DSY0_9ROSI
MWPCGIYRALTRASWGATRPCGPCPCSLPGCPLIETPRFGTHTGSWVSHTAVWPGRMSRDILGFKPNSSQRSGRAGFWFPNTQGTNPRERESDLGTFLELFWRISSPLELGNQAWRWRLKI